MQTKLTSVRLSIDAYNAIKANGYTIAELVLLGLKAKQDNPQLIKRVGDLEAKNARIAQKLTEINQKLLDFEGKNEPQTPKKPLFLGLFLMFLGTFSAFSGSFYRFGGCF